MSPRYIGRPIPRLDARDKVTGRQRYPSDFYPENMIWVKVLRARYPHARIVRVDTSAAERLPGVVRVLTAKDVPGENRYGMHVLDQQVFCDQKVRYLGDPIAAVGAETPEVAEDARDLIAVEYEPLEVLDNPLRAMEPDAPRVHDRDSNVTEVIDITKGDVAQGFAEADLVVEETFETQLMEHAYIEPEAGCAFYDEDGILTVVTGGQYPQHDQTQIARALGLRNEEVRVICPPPGGTFGGKDDVTIEIHLALMTSLTKRPSKICLSRRESIVAGTKRHPMTLRYRMGVTRDGRITALAAKAVSDTGAYLSYGNEVMGVCVAHLGGAYAIPHARLEGYTVYTNNAIAGAFRGFGCTQASVGIESMMDMVARRLGLDPVEFRARNCLRKGDRTAVGNPVVSNVGVRELLDAIRRNELWRERERIKAEMPGVPDYEKPYRRLGVGAAVAMKSWGYGSGVPDYAQARVRLAPDGRVQVLTGSVEYGTGNMTAYAQMVAEELGLDLEAVQVIFGDTKVVPDSGATNASRAIPNVGSAVVLAARDLRRQVVQVAAQELGVEPGRLDLVDGAVAWDGRRLPLADIARGRRLEGVGNFKAYQEEDEVVAGLPLSMYSSAANIALVSVDLLTGRVEVPRVEAIMDPGRIINQQGLEGQSEGGIVMGMSYVLYEHVVMERGVFKNPDLSTYILPTSLDAPDRIENSYVDVPDDLGPYGAKGMAEVVMVPIAPAILNAIDDAIGIRFTRLPVTPEEVVAALKAKGTYPI